MQDEIHDIRIAVSAQLEQLFRPWRPVFNISPSAGPGHEQLVAITNTDGRRSLRLARWWFIPWNWNKPLNQLPTTFNARAEQIGAKPIWRGALRSSRCLVPANGWREFKGPAGKKQPYHFHFDHKLFAFAGLTSTWLSIPGAQVDTFAIITTEANGSVAPVHSRMPLVVPASLYDNWLSEESDALQLLNELCAQNRQLAVQCYPSNAIANDVRYEGPLAIKQVAYEEPHQKQAQQSLFGSMPDSTSERPKRGHRRA